MKGPLGRPRDNPNYQPSPQPVTVYSGPDVPVAYDPNWQLYRNLTEDQKAWFRAQPEWGDFLAAVALSPATATVAMSAAQVNSVLQTAISPAINKLASPKVP